MKDQIITSHTHCQAAPIVAQTKAWQRVCLPLFKKEIFKNAPHSTKKKNYTDNETEQVKQELYNRLTLWTGNQKE